MIICYTVPEIRHMTDVIIWDIFCPFTTLTARKIKIKKNEKNAWRYEYFTQV